MDVGGRRRALLPSGGAVIAALQMGCCPALSCPLPPYASGGPLCPRDMAIVARFPSRV